MKPVILASRSPRRRELMELIGFPFVVRVSDLEETMTSREPAAVTEELSWQKAHAVAEELADEEGITVIGADTVVAVEGEILGKPAGINEARSMIRLLQGREHMVYTGVTVLRRSTGQREYRETFSEGTMVSVAPMSDREIEAYIRTEESYDKAGAYGIQGSFAKFIQGIHGDYYNVMGLPVHQLYDRLKRIMT